MLTRLPGAKMVILQLQNLSTAVSDESQKKVPSCHHRRELVCILYNKIRTLWKFNKEHINFAIFTIAPPLSSTPPIKAARFEVSPRKNECERHFLSPSVDAKQAFCYIHILEFLAEKLRERSGRSDRRKRVAARGIGDRD